MRDDDDYVSPFRIVRPETREEQDVLIDRFIALIRNLRDDHDKQPKDISRRMAVSRWLDLSSLLCGWAFDENITDMEREDSAARRRHISEALRTGSRHIHVKGDYSIVVLPGRLADELAYGLEVLKSGEVSALLLPANKKFKYTTAASLRALRYEIVRYARYYEGRGMSVDAAQGEVAAKCGVPISRVQSWAKGDGAERLSGNAIWDCRLAGAIAAGSSIEEAIVAWGRPPVLESEEEFDRSQLDPEAIEVHIRDLILPFFIVNTIEAIGEIYRQEEQAQKNLAALKIRKAGDE